MAARAKGAKKKVKPLPKYLYASVDIDGNLETYFGERFRTVTATNARSLGASRRSVRYVLESSIRPGGKP